MACSHYHREVVERFDFCLCLLEWNPRMKMNNLAAEVEGEAVDEVVEV